MRGQRREAVSSDAVVLPVCNHGGGRESVTTFGSCCTPPKSCAWRPPEILAWLLHHLHMVCATSRFQRLTTFWKIFDSHDSCLLVRSIHHGRHLPAKCPARVFPPNSAGRPKLDSVPLLYADRQHNDGDDSRAN